MLREDLYYRLNVFPIHLSPLRARLDDIPLLAEHFLRKSCRQLNKEVDGFGIGVIEMLQSYPWPGNVRELENEVQRAVALVEEGLRIQTYHFSEHIAREEALIQEIVAENNRYSDAVTRFQRRYIEQTLRECGWNRNEAARRLNMDNSNLRKLIRRLEIREDNE